MSSFQTHAPITLLITLLIIIPHRSSIETDGMLLLSFKYAILTDPFSVLQSWNVNDVNPCSWNGVTCGSPGAQNSTYNRVTGLSLPNSQLLGSIPAELALIEHLQILDLSNNSLNGSLPFTFSNATELRFLDLSNNLISGEIPDIFGCYNLQFLNLSDNALGGTLPANWTSLQNLTVVSLKNNYLFGNIPSRVNSVEVLDLSSNLFNCSLPSQFGGCNLRYFNVSYNRLSGPIPPEFAAKIPGNATIDLAYNNLTGQVPESVVFLNQKASDFGGNPNLCGAPTHNPCPIPSSVPSFVNVSSSPMSTPAIAAIPRTIDSSPVNAPSGSGLRHGTVIGIIVGDVAGVFILGLLFFYVYYLKKKKNKSENKPKTAARPVIGGGEKWSTSSTSSESRGFTRWSCLRQKKESEEDSGTSASSDEESTAGGRLVTVDGEKELEQETLLKASAYILGATGSSIMYKAVLEDGTALAVRRIGESHVERFRDFENQVRAISKLVHPNLVRIRGFYWGVEEKLLIYDFVPNGSLANSRFRKAGSSPCHLPWEARLRIVKGVARGLSYLHEKRHVHGNLKPSNILLGSDMEPRIGDFGLEKFVMGDSSYYKGGGSARNFGSKRSSASRDSFQEYPLGLGPSPSPSPSSIGGLSPYHAPESLRSLKPNPKWDVFSFGVILLELLTGKVIVVDEMGQGNNGLAVEDKNRALRMADVAIRSDVEGKEEALLACFKLGYSCASPLPQKRPSMKEALQVLDKFPSSTPTYYYGH